MLWIALSLPGLPLQLVQRAAPPAAQTATLVISEGPGLRPVVCCANAAAQALGIRAGQPLTAARALADSLEVRQRDPAAEARALHNLACWAGQFTPNVVLQDGGLLLEVASTLRLHGGITRLLAQLRQALAQLGYVASIGVAPTALAAWWLALARQAGLELRMGRDPQRLPELLAPLPLELLGWPQELLQPLQALGIQQLGQCLQLPRDGFIRRFGAERRLELDRALGLLPDPRPWFSPPEHFASRLEFGFELNDAQALLFPLQRLLRELEGFLRSRGAGVQQWQLQLEHWNHGRSQIQLGTAAPERSAALLLGLAREQLARLQLEAPVLALTLVARHLQPYAEHSQSLLPDSRSHALGWSQLIDRLSARLGSERISGLRSVDEHRPERGWRRCAASVAASDGSARALRTAPLPAASSAARPLWLLDPPRQLSSPAGQPQCQGQLELLAGPERIEAGWWDGDKASRDYYVARNPRGETLWIYREHQRDAPWYLHGIFA
jgi:protein ImuB